MPQLKKALYITLQLIFIVSTIFMILMVNGIWNYTSKGISTIKKGNTPCTVCCAPAIPRSYTSLRGQKTVTIFCDKHAPTTLQSSNWSWKGNVIFGWFFGAVMPLLFPIVSLVFIIKDETHAKQTVPALSGFEALLLITTLIKLMLLSS